MKYVVLKIAISSKRGKSKTQPSFLYTFCLCLPFNWKTTILYRNLFSFASKEKDSVDNWGSISKLGQRRNFDVIEIYFLFLLYDTRPLLC